MANDRKGKRGKADAGQQAVVNPPERAIVAENTSANVEETEAADLEAGDSAEETGGEETGGEKSAEADSDDSSRGRTAFDPLTNPLWFSPEQAEAIRGGVAAGHISATPAKVTIRAKSNPATKRDESQPFICYLALDFVGQVLLSLGKEEPATEAPESGDDNRTEADKSLGACDYFNHGFYLKRYNSPIRVMLEDLIAGPEKEIAKRVKSLLEGKLFKTEAKARALVIRQRVLEGLVVPTSDMADFYLANKIEASGLAEWIAANQDE